MVLIDKAALLNKIAKEVHYDSEHSLEMYAKMLSLINDAPEVALTLVDANGNAVDCGRRIDADKLKEHYSWWEGGSQEMTLDEAKRTFDTIVDLQPTVSEVEDG